MSVEKRMEELRQMEVETPEQLKVRATNELVLPSTWKVSNETRGMINQSMEIYNTKHGLYASVLCYAKVRVVLMQVFVRYLMEEWIQVVLVVLLRLDLL